MTTKRVRDLTSALNENAFVKQDCRVGELVGVFEKLNRAPGDVESVVLVTDARGRAIGMVTPLDLLGAVEPQFMDPEYNCEVYWPGLFNQRCRNISDKPVVEIMRPLVTVNAEDTLMRAVNLIRRRQVDTLLVLDGDRVTGTLGVGGLLRAMADDSKARADAVA